MHKPLFISHRGNLNGPNPQLENSPDYLQAAIDKGFTVETDLWWNPHGWYFGHDKPQYNIDPDWIHTRSNQLLLHLKNLPLTILPPLWHHFAHSSDPFSLTNKGFLWIHDQPYRTHALLPPNSILQIVSPKQSLHPNFSGYGYCSDFQPST